MSEKKIGHGKTDSSKSDTSKTQLSLKLVKKVLSKSLKKEGKPPLLLKSNLTRNDTLLLGGYEDQ